MTRFKQELHFKVRNIRLISETDPLYRSYIDSLKLDHYHLRPKGNKKYSDVISFPLEKTVREWIKASGSTIEERIISYEVLFQSNEYKKRFNEVDTVLFQQNKYTLVEVKVCSSEKKIVLAKSQLAFDHKLLLKIGINAELLIIYINLNFKNIPMDYQDFNPDFSKMLPTICNDDLKYNYLMLTPVDIFAWGLKQGIIINPNLLKDAINEVEAMYQKRIRCQELKDANIPRSEWSKDLLEEEIKMDNEDYTITYGDDKPDDSFAAKLQEALKKK